MEAQRRLSTAGILLALCCVFPACSGEDIKTPSPDVKEVALEIVEVAPQKDVGTAPFCGLSSHCEDGFCDKLTSSCTECYVEAHCPDGSVCISGHCASAAECSGPEECGGMACAADKGYCVECLNDSDCPSGKWCWNEVCRAEPAECTGQADCQSMAGECAPGQGHCLDCGDDDYCAHFETCQDYACLPEPCTPGHPECVGDSTAKVCRADGSGFYFLECDEGSQCMQGVCVEPNCTPGEYTCVDFVKSLCVLDPAAGGLVYKPAPCPPGEVCIGTECRPLRHRALFVFDTSGSMNWLPNTEEMPDFCPLGEQSTPENPCFGLYPNCESKDAPFSKLGISKKVFKNLLQTEEAEAAFCALMRFPQVLKIGSANCEGGYFEGDVWMTGHQKKQEHAAPDEPDNWFDSNLAEVLLQPFPPDHDSYLTWNVARWFNFTEDIEDTGLPCGDDDACDGAGWCMGVPQPTCKLFNDPEVMAHGWTPLGRTLFYAGEYVRRHVIVDGKECEVNSDCGSVGYLCSSTGKCFDPFYKPDPDKTCRQNVVVLFTDGQETENPEHSFFNPAVQAKRFHFGLGCEDDDDCLNGATCVDDACYHHSMEIEGVPPVEFKGTEGLRTLRDRNGSPISLTIHVVDASGPDAHNSQIAAYGGGDYYAVSMDDEVDFLKKLVLTLDIKTLAQNCLVSDEPL